jgi:hypothetical protein
VKLFCWSCVLLAVVASVAGAQPGIATSSRAVANFEVEVVTLTKGGFEPKRIVRKPGAFRLVLRNFLDGKTTPFEIVDSSGVKRKDFEDNKNRAKQVQEQLDLGPGTYTLRLRTQPTIQMQIVIDPNQR